MNCAACGGPMRLEEAKEYLICGYCGNIHFPDPDADGVRVLDEPADQSCPVCRIPLVHAALDGRRILFCGRCRGMLIPIDIFVALIQDLRARCDTCPESERPADWKDLKRQVHCPQCGGQMDTHPYGGPGNIIIDNCPRCRVNWLDHSELARIVRAPDRAYDDNAWMAP